MPDSRPGFPSTWDCWHIIHHQPACFLEDPSEALGGVYKNQKARNAPGGGGGGGGSPTSA